MSIKNIKIDSSKIFKEVKILTPSVYNDLRGNIYTSYSAEIYTDLLPKGTVFHHDKFAESKFNVLRGLHGDNKTWKLVSCVFGEIYEVVVDMRKDSPTYLKWEAFNLNSNAYKQVLIPPNFVNGYYVKSDRAVFHYKLAYEGDYIDANEQLTFRWDNPKMNIIWPCKQPILQDRDI
jgi:dTDP-4-dehydrorhamnose 3,5-epimerase